MAPGASLVCNVEKTRCPVIAARDGDLRRVLVADLPDHDDIGILSENTAQRGGES